MSVDTAGQHLIIPSMKPGTRDVERLLRTNGPVTAQVSPIDEHNTFNPAL